MKIEKLNKKHGKRFALSVVGVIAIAMVGIFATSFAKYKSAQSIPLVSGVITYKAPDFTIVAIKWQKQEKKCTDENCYEDKNVMPGSDYIINEDKSYCMLNSSKDDNARLYTNDDGEHIISNLSKGDKCYLYFDKKSEELANTTLAKLNVAVSEGEPDFSKTSCSSNCGESTVGVYVTTDETGNPSYYYRGDVTNNYLKFANKWWRIIRINGDGTIRIIYEGDKYYSPGTSKTNSFVNKTIYKFNQADGDNAYVGFMYGMVDPRDNSVILTYDMTHANTNKSVALTQLETWYTSNLKSYASYIDVNAGFCGDRTPSSNSNGEPNGANGYSVTETYYGSYLRTITGHTPSLSCAAHDLYTVAGADQGNKALTYPIGLINADEVSLAGGAYWTPNPIFYLYCGEDFWTMSPGNVSSAYHAANIVYNFMGLYNAGVEGNSYGLRPVINLRADVTITGSGTENSPYEVS